MPSSPFLHLSAHLVVADLAKSITFNPVKRRSVEASQNADQAQRYILEKGTKVSEIVLPPRGMSGRLNMIMDSTSGKAQFPFMMVRAGDELFRIQRKDQLSVGQRALLKIAKVNLPQPSSCSDDASLHPKPLSFKTSEHRVQISLAQNAQISQDKHQGASASTDAGPNATELGASILSDLGLQVHLRRGLFDKRFPEAF